MNLVGIMPVRNEDWILGLSARVALTWCDGLVILDHASTDGTPGIIEELRQEFGERITALRVQDDQWDEMAHRQTLLSWATCNGMGATHIALIDADEILTGNLLGSIREHVARLNTGQMLTLPLYNLRGGLNRYHLNGIWGQRVVSLAFKDVNTAGFKGDKFHHREPQGVQWQAVNTVNQGAGGVMHLWASSLDRLHEKHRLYRVMERLRFPDKPIAEIERMYSWAERGEPGHPRYGTPETWTFTDAPASWWEPYQGLMGYLNLENEPWQKAECERIIEQHGREHFRGLSI
jgi:hypothetical protein